MSKEVFDQILEAIDESPDSIPSSILLGIKTNDPYIWGEARDYYNYDNILLIMNSSIFHDGGLRGKSTRGETTNIKVYSIIDLNFFILRASVILAKKDIEEIFQESISDFDTAIKEIKSLQYVAQFYRSTSSFKKLEKIIQELTNIKSHLKNKPNPNKQHFRLYKTERQGPNRIDNLIQLFEEQVPEAPSFTIGRAIHMLLSHFGIPSSEAAITQRIYRKKLKK